ncbi:MAG: hypothetical protein ACRDXE_05235 [Acidimicrobiales bacterium]
MQSSVLAVAGGFIVVASQAFATDVTAWLAFAIGVGAVVVAFVPVLAGARRWILALDVATTILAVWTIIASLVFSGGAVQWLSFAEGLGLVGLAALGLTVDHLRLATVARASAPATDATDAGISATRPSAVAA